MSRKMAIKAKCLDCMCFSYNDRRDCDFTDCPLHPYRLGECDKGKSIERSLAIKQFCTDCCCGNRQEVVNCACVDCPLYPYKAFTTNKIS